MKLTKEEDKQKQREDRMTNISNYHASDSEEDVRTRVYDRFRIMKNSTFRSEAENDWDNADVDYRQYKEDQDSDDFRSNINKPITFSIVETEVQETIDRKSRPRVDARENDDVVNAELVNDTMRYSFDVGDFDLQWYLARKESFIYGTGLIFDYYREDKRTVKKVTLKKGKDGDLEEEETLEERTDFDDCYAEYVPIRSVYFDEAANHISKARDCIRREIIDIQEMKRRYENKRGFKNVEFVVAGGDTNMYQFFQPPQNTISSQDVEILHYYNRATDEYLVVCNDVVIREGAMNLPHKELPFVVLYCYKIPDKFYGLGIPKIIKDLVSERNTLSNQRIDTVKMAINKMFFFDDMVELDDIDLIARPHGGIPVNTQGRPINQVIQWTDYSDVKPSSYREEEVILEDIRRASGIDDRVQGVNVGGTATEAALLKESSMKRINAQMMYNEMDAVVRLGRLRLENIKFFYGIPKIEKIVGKNKDVKFKKTDRVIKIKGREYTINEDGQLKYDPKEGISYLKMTKKFSKFLEGEFDIIFDGTAQPPLSKPLQQQKVNEMFDRLTANPKTLSEVDGRKAALRILQVNDETPDAWMRKEVVDIPDMQIHAEHENQMMIGGYPLPPTMGITPEHTAVHLYFTRTREFEEAPEEIQSIFEQHINGEAGEAGLSDDGQGGANAQRLQDPSASMGEVIPGLPQGGA